MCVCVCVCVCLFNIYDRRKNPRKQPAIYRQYMCIWIHWRTACKKAIIGGDLWAFK